MADSNRTCIYCDEPAAPGVSMCEAHLEAHEEEMDQLAAMAHLGCDEYGSLG